MKALIILVTVLLIFSVTAAQDSLQTGQQEKIQHYMEKAIQAYYQDSCWLACSYIADSIVFQLTPMDSLWHMDNYPAIDTILHACEPYFYIVFAETRIKLHLDMGNHLGATLVHVQAIKIMEENNIEIPKRFDEYEKKILELINKGRMY